MTDGHEIDTAALQSYLSSELDVTVTDTELLHEALNLSLAVSTEETEHAYVLRQPNRLRDTESFNELAHEFEVLERLAETDVDAPEPVLLCEDESVIGDPFLVMTYLDGEPVRLGEPLPEQFQTPDAHSHVGTLLVETLAEIHSLDIEPFEEFCELRTPQQQVRRDVERLDSATAVTGHDPSQLREVVDWLRENAPAERETTLVHGDYRPSNLLFADGDAPEIAGVLDWETAFLGDPRTDLGYLLLRWRDDGDPTPSLADIEKRHSNEAAIQDLRETNEQGLAPFTNEPGSPTRRELVSHYECLTGISFDDERFYRALAAFGLATVWADIHRHQLESGVDSHWEPYIEYMSMVARSIVEGELS